MFSNITCINKTVDHTQAQPGNDFYTVFFPLSNVSITLPSFVRLTLYLVRLSYSDLCCMF